jgi:hypothetical protein
MNVSLDFDFYAFAKDCDRSIGLPLLKNGRLFRCIYDPRSVTLQVRYLQHF